VATTTDVAKNGSRGGPGAARSTANRSPSTAVASATQRLARRNRTRIALGAFLVVACALAAVVLFSRAGNRHPVLAVTHRVNAGSTISTSDLVEVMVSADASVATVPASQRAQLVGQVATVDLVPGSLIAPGQFDARPRDTANEAIVGATLKEGQFPPELRAGDRVLVIEVPGDNAPNSNGTTTSVNGTIVSVDPSTAQGGVTVALAVDPSHAQAVAVDAARGRLTVVIAPA
jgi:hypothetical protein